MQQTMDGFYTKVETAKVLGVSLRQVHNYVTEEKLRSTVRGRYAYFPKEDVERLLLTGRKKLPGLEDIQEHALRLLELEKAVEVLKLGLGYNKRRAPRNDSQLAMLRQRILDTMTQDSWAPKKMYEIADELWQMHEDEMAALVRACGATAWYPFTEIADRMMAYIEGLPDFPNAGLEILHARLTRGKDRILGIIQVSSKASTAAIAEKALGPAPQPPAGFIDDYVLSYVLGRR